jgi:hypothetical protein
MKITIKYEFDNGDVGDVVYDNVAWTATLPDGKVLPYSYVEGSKDLKVNTDGGEVTVSFSEIISEVGQASAFSTSAGQKGNARVSAIA